MALQGGHRFGVEFGQVFPHGAYAVGPVEQANDFDRSTKDNKVQARDEKGTGLPVWTVQVMDADPSVKGQAKTVTVKVAAERQPVLPDAQGLPFVAVEFTGLTVTPYVDSKSGRLAYSFRADGVQAPSAKPRDEAATVSNGSSVKSASSAASGSGKSAAGSSESEG